MRPWERIAAFKNGGTQLHLFAGFAQGWLAGYAFREGHLWRGVAMLAVALAYGGSLICIMIAHNLDRRAP